MFVTMKHLWLIASLLVFSMTLRAGGPKGIFIDHEFTKARYIGPIIVDDYDSVNWIIHFRWLGRDNGKDSAFLIQVKDDWQDNRFSLKLRTPDSAFWAHCDRRALWGGHLPMYADTVIAVIDSSQRTLVFAKLMKENYRFWWPVPDHKVSTFLYNAPFTYLSHFNKPGVGTSGYEGCSDGCELPKKYIGRYLKLP